MTLTPVSGGGAYYLQVNGQRLDRQLLNELVGACKARGDGRVSLNDLNGAVLDELNDARGVTDTELATLIYARLHFNVKFTDASNRKLVEVIKRERPKVLMASGGVREPVAYTRLVDQLERIGRLDALYSVKFKLPGEGGLTDLWDNGISLSKFNSLLQHAHLPHSKTQLAAIFEASTVAEVQDFLRSSDPAAAELLESGKMSAARFSNERYGMWETKNPSIAGFTPYNAKFVDRYLPVL